MYRDLPFEEISVVVSLILDLVVMMMLMSLVAFLLLLVLEYS